MLSSLAPTAENHSFNQMPYTYHNQSSALIASSDTWTVKEAQRLIRRLQSVKFSYVDSRNSGHEAMARFLEAAKSGDDHFSTTDRFANDLTDVFVCTYYPDISRTVTGLASVLSWRGTNRAKDTEVGDDRKEAKNNMEWFLVTDQAVQDNTKRFESLVNEFAIRIMSADCVLTRETFEQLGATWSE